jgi:hypothetical protein
VPLPGTSYRDTWAFIMSKNSPYKGLINWRWDNKIKSVKYLKDSSTLVGSLQDLQDRKKISSLLRPNRLNSRKVRRVCTVSQISYVLLDIIVNLWLKTLCNWEYVNIVSSGSTTENITKKRSSNQCGAYWLLTKFRNRGNRV